MHINFSVPPRKPRGVLAQILTAVLGAVVLVGAAMFSLVFLAVIAVAGLVFWVYFWWKTRAVRARIEEQLRRQAPFDAPGRDQATRTPPAAGDVIEGEAVRVTDGIDADRRLE